MRFIKGGIYRVDFYDHFETSDFKDKRGVLCIVGRYVERRGVYHIFENWWVSDEDDTLSVGTTYMFVVKGGIVKAKRIE